MITSHHYLLGQVRIAALVFANREFGEGDE
jgi:hypothetical protein